MGRYFVMFWVGKQALNRESLPTNIAVVCGRPEQWRGWQEFMYVAFLQSVCFCCSDDEIPSSSDEEQVKKAQEKRRSLPKRKLRMEEYPEFIAKRYADFRTYRNNVLQKWHEKTKLASGKMGKASPALWGLTMWSAEGCGTSACGSFTRWMF